LRLGTTQIAPQPVVAGERHELWAGFGGKAGTNTSSVVGAEPERESARAIQDSSAQVRRWHGGRSFVTGQ
jgi:hypothetical protein